MLAQIDETAALTPQANDSVMLPSLLVRRTQSEPLGPGEKTPHADSSPVADPAVCYPSTPTPRNAGVHTSFGLGGGEITPEAWPEQTIPQHFRFGMQPAVQQPQQPQAGSFPGMTMAPMPFFGAMPAAAGATGTMPAMTPIWPGQFPGAAGMMPGMVPMPTAQQAVGQSHNQGRLPEVPQRPQLPMEPRQAGHSLKSADNSTRASAGGKKNTTVASSGGSNANSNGQPACPVAVYVDLSTLRERGPAVRRPELSRKARPE